MKMVTEEILKERARSLRKQHTFAEMKLWRQLRARRFEQYKFRRQHPIGSYIVDFVCLWKRLIVELDGGQHAEQQGYDEKRTSFLENEEYKVMRFWIMRC